MFYVIAHRDGWFDASGDNASGVATMPGLAEYYAHVPRSQRRRTMIFIGTDGHHQNSPGGYGREWLAANRERFFSRTALMINAEHPSEVLTRGGTAGPRLCARIIDEVNKLPLTDLQRVPQPNKPRIDFASCPAWVKDSSAACTENTERACAVTAAGC